MVGVTVAVFYLALLPFVARTWRATGDEPHYLLAAHSLAVDFDLDLANNYDQLDYLAFYYHHQLDRQIRTDQAGQQILNHQLGLPVLIAPIYALGGRTGVLAMQAVLGGFLAALTFKLARFISQDETAALGATLVVALSPPLLMYPYLVYPELIGAFLTTLVLYFAVTRDEPTPGAFAVVVLSLITLPWLNRRFMPLALVLALLILWAWRKKSMWVGVSGLLATIFSMILLYWFQSHLNQPVRADIIAPPEASVFWSRLGRGVGWLLDQQRGLFIFAPIYLLALWGMPFLIHHSLKQTDRHWFVVIPFLLTLGVTVLAGGYWIPWELGPRPLVVALPALAPALALAWRYYRQHKLWVGLTFLLAICSLANSLLIIRNPELPYKSSLPLYYGQKSGLPLTELLPDLAGYARISAVHADPISQTIGLDSSGPVWFVPVDQALPVAQARPLHELPFGHYRLTWPVRVDPDLPPATELIRLSANFLGGGQRFNQIVTASDLPDDGRYGLIEYAFSNPNVDRWRTPLLFHAVSTGRSNVWGQDILFAPDPFYAWFLPYLYLGLLVAGAVLAWHRVRQNGDRLAVPTTKPLFVWPKLWGWAVLAIFIGGVSGYLLYEHNRPARTYDAVRLNHLVGQPIQDIGANDGQAWLVDPRTDPPQTALYGPFDIFDQGRYHVAFRLRLARPAETEQPVARLRIRDATEADLFVQPLRLEHFSDSELYHDFVLLVDNPRRQALSFEVDYLGTAPLIVDEVTITAPSP